MNNVQHPNSLAKNNIQGKYISWKHNKILYVLQLCQRRKVPEICKNPNNLPWLSFSVACILGVDFDFPYLNANYFHTLIKSSTDWRTRFIMLYFFHCVMKVEKPAFIFPIWMLIIFTAWSKLRNILDRTQMVEHPKSDTKSLTKFSITNLKHSLQYVVSRGDTKI